LPPATRVCLLSLRGQGPAPLIVRPGLLLRSPLRLMARSSGRLPVELAMAPAWLSHSLFWARQAASTRASWLAVSLSCTVALLRLAARVGGRDLCMLWVVAVTWVCRNCLRGQARAGRGSGWANQALLAAAREARGERPRQHGCRQHDAAWPPPLCHELAVLTQQLLARLLIKGLRRRQHVAGQLLDRAQALAGGQCALAARGGGGRRISAHARPERRPPRARLRGTGCTKRGLKGLRIAQHVLGPPVLGRGGR